MSDNFDAWVRLSEGFLRAHLHCLVEFCVRGFDARHVQPVVGHLRELRLIPRPDGSRDLTVGLCYESAGEPFAELITGVSGISTTPNVASIECARGVRRQLRCVDNHFVAAGALPGGPIRWKT